MGTRCVVLEPHIHSCLSWLFDNYRMHLTTTSEWNIPLLPLTSPFVLDR